MNTFTMAEIADFSNMSNQEVIDAALVARGFSFLKKVNTSTRITVLFGLILSSSNIELIPSEREGLINYYKAVFSSKSH